MSLTNRILALALLFVSGAASSAPVSEVRRIEGSVIEFWHSMTGRKGKLLQELVDLYNHPAAGRLRPSVRVELQFAGSYEEGLNKLRTALMAGKGPAVMQITDIGTKVMIDSGAIVPLDEFIRSDKDFPLSLILPQIRRYYEIDGKLHSLPFAASNPILYYNIDAFAKAGLSHPPASYPELEEACHRLASAESRTTGLTWPLTSWLLEQFVARQGVALALPANGRSSVGPATEIDLLGTESLEFISLWGRLVKSGCFANVGRGWDPAQQNFLAGRSLMLITSTSDAYDIVTRAPFHVGTAPIPARGVGPAAIAVAEKQGGTVIGGNSLWILKGKSPAELAGAYAFLKFMASAEIQRQWHLGTGYFPIRSDVIDALEKEGYYRKNPAIWTSIAQLRRSPEAIATRGALLGTFPEVREHVASAVEEVLAGMSDVPTALGNAKKKIDQSMKRYNRGRHEH